MKKNNIEKIAVLTCIIAFCFSGFALADPLIDVRITNRVASGGILKFDVEVRAGAGYRANEILDGDMTAANLRLDIFTEPGVTITVPPPPQNTTHDMESLNVYDVTYGRYPNANYIGSGTAPQSVSIQIGRDNSYADVSKDLGSEFTRIAMIEIPYTGKLTDATIVEVRKNENYSNPIRWAGWANDNVVRYFFSETTRSTVSTPAIEYMNEVNVYLANGELTVISPDAETVRVFNAIGVLVYVADKQAGKVIYPVSGFVDGFYIVTGSNGWSAKVSKK